MSMENGAAQNNKEGEGRERVRGKERDYALGKNRSIKPIDCCAICSIPPGFDSYLFFLNLPTL